MDEDRSSTHSRLTRKPGIPRSRCVGAYCTDCTYLWDLENEINTNMGKGHRSTSSTISGSGDHPSDNKHEQKLQAVLFADSFVNTFRPITLDRSTAKVLCPLNNVTMLDYSIEFLAGAGVEEIFVFCVHGADEVERYVLQSTWSSVLQVHCVKDATCANPGDALRELVRSFAAP